MKKSQLFLSFVTVMFFAACSVNQQDLGSVENSTGSQVAQTEKVKQLTEAEIQAFAKPGPNHKLLNSFVGNWKTTSIFWMDPTQKPQISSGSAKANWVLGGKFIKEDYQEGSGKKFFQGVGYYGYDNVMKEFTSVWLDTMGTGVMLAKGSADPQGKTFIFQGSFSCPLVGGEKESKNVVKIESKNKRTFEMFDKGPDGKEYKVLEIVYTRK